jgi:CheY-like chemotaxis protein/anti-sigma regulatory factor (Ser/Thr protein kinase)
MTLGIDPLRERECKAVAEEVMALLRHDLSNKLTSILNAICYLKRIHKKAESSSIAPRTEQFLTLIENEAGAAAERLDECTELERQIQRRVERLDAAACIKQALAWARVADTVEFKVEAGPGEVEADPFEIALAIRCLIENAAEAMAGRGAVKVSVQPKDGKLGIFVENTGPAFAENEQRQMMKPFYSTKETRAGLGLNIAQRIAHRYGGQFTLHSSDGVITAALKLPLATATQKTDPAVGSVKLLLVEDDPSNRLTLQALLEDAGFQVDTAASFAEAKQKVSQADVDYRVVLLDQHLGDGLGVDLLPLAREHRPTLRTLLLSGSVDGAQAAEAASMVDAILPKGTAFADILAWIEVLLQ